MIVAKLKGGLGNQMFQYATGLRVARAQKEELNLDISGYDDPRYVHANTPRTYRLFPFNLSAGIATGEEIRAHKYPYGIISKASRFLQYRVFKKGFYIDYEQQFFAKKHTYLEGYFQSEKNFLPVKEELLREFSLKEEFARDVFLKERERIQGTRGVSVHIRRGDYVEDQKTNAFHGTCSPKYYQNAIAYMRTHIESPTFYFFSDDIGWVQKEFGGHADFKYISNPKLEDYEELMLMAACAHNIIANSSFSWWGAYLNKNPNKIVIAPQKWMNKEPDQHPNITPESWTRL